MLNKKQFSSFLKGLYLPKNCLRSESAPIEAVSYEVVFNVVTGKLNSYNKKNQKLSLLSH